MKRCTICEEKEANGIQLHASFICTACENTIIHTDPREEKYQYYVRKLKNIKQPNQFQSYHDQACHKPV